ncbi:MAG: alpha/beta fold hydrolase [Sphingomonas sp.]|nr:alpha/beta fold hydrolase [Sphingomonas sp.]
MFEHDYHVTGGHDIRISETGEGPPVVLIHGSGPGASGCSNFGGNIDALAGAGFRVLAPDLIGYGSSSKPVGLDYTLDLFTDSLVEALKAAGISRASLIGNSLGGAIAIKIALDHPEMVDRLILMAPGGIETREAYFAMPGIAKMVGDFTSSDFDIEDMRKLVSNLVYDPSLLTDELIAERFAVARTQPKDVLARMRVPDLSDRLGELTMPILGFWGAEDGFCPASGAQKFLTACSDVRFILYARVGHWVMVEQRDEFNRHAIDFLTH